MPDKFFKHWEANLDPFKPMTRPQYRLIKWLCGNNHFIRAESVARQITIKDLENLNQVEAHEIIIYLNDYDCRDERLINEDIEAEFGRALILLGQGKSIADSKTRALALLATNRVATLGQLGRYVYGVAPQIYHQVHSLIEPLVESMLSEGMIGCERNFRFPLSGKQAVANIYFLTETGSDQLHRIAPNTNYYARPSLPQYNRLFHEICVTAARLDFQANNHLMNYEPEWEIKSQFQKALNRRLRDKQNAIEFKDFYAGCGDFRALVVDPKTGVSKLAEVEIIVRSRLNEVSSKPARITDYYVASIHRSFLIEFTQRKFAKIVPDLFEPCGSVEIDRHSYKLSSKHATVSEERLQKVRSALATMGGIGTTGSVAMQCSLKVPTVSEALAILVEQDEITYCDGFGPTGKLMGRNLRLFHPKSMKINSIFEFGRLLTAAKFVSSKLASLFSGIDLEVIAFEPVVGLLFLNNDQKSHLTIIIIDDPSELVERVIRWGQAVYKHASRVALNGIQINPRMSINRAHTNTALSAPEASDNGWKGLTKDHLFIAVYGNKRTQQFRNLAELSIVDVVDEEKNATGFARKNRHKRKRNGGKEDMKKSAYSR